MKKSAELLFERELEKIYLDMGLAGFGVVHLQPDGTLKQLAPTDAAKDEEE